MAIELLFFGDSGLLLGAATASIIYKDKFGPKLLVHFGRTLFELLLGFEGAYKQRSSIALDPKLLGLLGRIFEPLVEADHTPRSLFGLLLQPPHRLEPRLVIVLPLNEWDAKLLAASLHIQKAQAIFAIRMDIGIVKVAYQILAILLLEPLQEKVAIDATADMYQHHQILPKSKLN